MALDKLFEKYDRLVIFDTETTGLQFSRDEIIEFSAVVLEQENGELKILQEYDQLITLSTCDKSIDDGRFVVVARRVV